MTKTNEFERHDGPESKLSTGSGQSQMEGNATELMQEAPGEDVTDEMLREDQTNPHSWLYWNKGPEEAGYSPASLITRDNVDSLSLKYTIDEYDGSDANPTIVPGDPPVLYYPRQNADPGQQAWALNARTGEPYWSFTYQNEELEGATLGSRGMAVWGDKAYLGALDMNVIALNRYTGEQQWVTNSLTPKQREEMSRPDRMSYTSALVTFDGTIYKGMSGYYGGWGAYVAIDAESGEMTWHQTVISEDEWVGDSWRHGDASPWGNAAIDAESRTIFIPGANPGPMFNGPVRPGPNKHSDSVIAVDLDSGEIQWTTQQIAHDEHDWDTLNTRIVDVEVGGEQQRVVEAINKTGFLYFLDMETGQLIDRTEPYAKQGGETGFMGQLPKGEENKQTAWPDSSGATTWSPDSFSPETGLVYVSANDRVTEIWYENYEYKEDIIEVNTGGNTSQVDLEEYPEFQAHLVAIDPSTGEVAWRHSFPPAQELESQAPSRGMTATAGNVVFAGSPESNLVAVDAESGEMLAEYNISNLPGSIAAAPVTWVDEAENNQYVALAAAEGIFVYSLDD